MENIYAIKDNKVSTFNKPMVEPHLTVVQRQLQQVMQNPKSMLAQWPQDYDVYLIGKFDSRTGEVIPSPPTLIFNCIELVQMNKNPNQEEMELGKRPTINTAKNEPKEVK